MALDRSKRLPPLKSLMGPTKAKEQERQTWQQQLTIVKAMNAAFGGTVTARDAHA